MPVFENLILYTTDDGLTELQLKAQDGTVWLTQNEIADLFQKSRSTIAEHIQNIFSEGELEAESVCRNFRRTAADKKSYDTQYYNLDLILAVGYRIKSSRGVQFRKWATTTLKEYLIKGFVINDERLKDPQGSDYFDELLERIREIRTSEKLFYQKVKDIYAKSVDYDKNSEQAQIFFKTVQNKMLYASTGMTAAELVKHRSNSALPNMGLTNWKAAKTGGSVRKSDVITAKNYLNEDELTNLNRIVTMFLDHAEDTASRRQVIYMKDWEMRLDDFLRFNERPILTHAGSVSHELAETIAYERYAAFDQQRSEQEAILSEIAASEELKVLEMVEEMTVTLNKKIKSKKNENMGCTFDQFYDLKLK
jgi:hypothetical protein